MRAALSAAVAACAVTAVLPAAALAEPTAMAGVAGGRDTGVERISVAADGTQGDDKSAGASITPDGRHIVFSSSAKNLTPDETTGGDKVFVRDQQTSLTKRIGYLTTLQPPAISGNGEYAAYPVQWMNNVRIRQYEVGSGRTASADCSAYSCDQPSLNADGLHIALAILIRRPPSSQRIEVQDWNTGGTKQTVATLGHTEPSRPSISGDGRYVAYQDGKTQDVFVWDRTSGTTTGPIEGPSKGATLVQLSDDGGKVVYLSGSDTYVHDLASGTARLVPNVRGVAIDPTGRYLLYTPNDTTGPSLTLRDLQTDTDEIVSDQPASAGTDAVSADGRAVVFQSTADDIVPGDTNGKSDVFVRHFS
ncbi:PD40 domain-containing protein [Streptomyces sp. ERV7]|uniref:PD40 domain-containing protein n=1 Tax=Streptomyces sp. ERV7 TaxID=1322334 RepID=UPI0009A05E3D|nr:PD40 domain-containing protein [Streptomyces sp. ERV7]